ncbi:MAG: CBS domain-containing protein [Actinobacteria bacterium]|nr:CBS domain-containing protein [Actinomycetota bacterium]MBU1944723.1 CBS domain-containing protein [Actinomycetota bacterium]MBU2688019.1 CBS domain-containing protein [Actinomycetota bacterium]
MAESKEQPYLAGRVENVMTINPVIVRVDRPLKELVNLFLAHHYHGVPVVNADGKLVGVVRDSEILSMFAGRDPFVGEYRTVGDIMHVPPFVIGPKETIQRAALKMFVDGTRFLVVVEKGDSVIGVVTRVDLIRGIQWRVDGEGS